MVNAWIEALKEYNKGHDKWCVVKKGTPEYNEVKKIMERKQGKTPKEAHTMYKNSKSVMPNRNTLNANIPVTEQIDNLLNKLSLPPQYRRRSTKKR